MWQQFILDASNYPQFLTDYFISMGWYGIPGDGCECLYAPIGR